MQLLISFNRQVVYSVAFILGVLLAYPMVSTVFGVCIKQPCVESFNFGFDSSSCDFGVHFERLMTIGPNVYAQHGDGDIVNTSATPVGQKDADTIGNCTSANGFIQVAAKCEVFGQWEEIQNWAFCTWGG